MRNPFKYVTTITWVVFAESLLMVPKCSKYCYFRGSDLKNLFIIIVTFIVSDLTFLYFSVFYQLIHKHQAMMQTSKQSKKTIGPSSSLLTKMVIPVRKYDAEVFRMLLDFVHCGTVNISEDTVAGKFIW